MSKWSQAFRDSRWQEKRLLVMQRDEFTCRSCGRKVGITLNVHHIYYEKNKAPWEYDDDMLITWCEDCHTKRHELQKELLLCLANLEMDELKSTHFIIENIPHVVNIVMSLYYNCRLSNQIDNILVSIIHLMEANNELAKH